MSYQQNHGVTVDSPGGAIARTNNYSSGQHAGYSGTIPEDAATTIPNISIDVSQMVAAFLYCDRDVVLTFNDDGTPDATVTLVAGVPLNWTNDGYFTNPLGVVDITSFKATLAAGEDANLIVDVLYD